MEVRFLTLALTERISDAWAIPHGRRVTARLERLPFVSAGTQSPDPEWLQLVVEVKREPEGEFEEAAVSTQLLSAGIVELDVPTKPEPLKFGEHPGVFRLRIVHYGRMDMRFALTLEGF